MGSVAGKTLPFPNRSVDDRFFHLLQFRMAGIAEPGNVLQEQPLVTGEVRAVTGRALPFHDWVVPDLFLKSGAFVAGEAIHSGQGLSAGDGQKKNSTGQSDANRKM